VTTISWSDIPGALFDNFLSDEFVVSTISVLPLVGCILTGDFNCPDINWDTMTVNQDAQDKEIQRAVMEVVTANLIVQIHEQPTRGNNLLDIVLTWWYNLVFFLNIFLILWLIHGRCDFDRMSLDGMCLSKHSEFCLEYVP
jgi:hypothetical protein